jgi:hypothetical protein
VPSTCGQESSCRNYGGAEDNLFLSCTAKPGAKQVPLPHTGLVTGIKTLAQAAGVDPKKHSGHYLRRGGATLAFQLGLRSHLIKEGGEVTRCFGTMS